MSIKFKKLLDIKSEMNDVFSDVEKAYYPMKDELSKSQPFSVQHIENIKEVALKIEKIIKSLPESELKKNLQRKLTSAEIYRHFMKDNKPGSNVQGGFWLGHCHFQTVKPLLKNVLRQLIEYYADDTVELRSAADIAFEHLQKSIIVNKVQKEEWESTWNDQNLETRFEKLGEVHLLSHNIWSAKFNVEGARTDLVLKEPILDTQIDITEDKYQSREGLLLTEWKGCREPKNVEKLIDGAIKQAAQYLSPHLSGFEFARLCYIVIVSKDYIDIGNKTRLIDGITFRIVNVACVPSSPSDQSKKT